MDTSQISDDVRKKVEREYLAKLLARGGPTVEKMSQDYVRKTTWKDGLLTVCVLSCLVLFLYTLIQGGFCFHDGQFK